MKSGISALVIVAGLAIAPAYADAQSSSYDWTGFYAGPNVGFGWSDRSFTTTPGGTLVSIPFDGSLSWGTHASGPMGGFFSVGAQGGYNYQNDIWVVGVETDIQSGSENRGLIDTFSPGATISNEFTSKSSWFGTTRLRLGTTWVNPDVLVYITGGVAYGNENAGGLMTATLNGTTVETFPFNTTKTSIGFAVGGGSEFAINDGWTLRAEYLHVELGKQSQTLATTTLGPSALPTDFMTLSAADYKLNLIRFALNYRF